MQPNRSTNSNDQVIFYSLSEVLDKPLFNAEFGDQEHDFDVELRGFALYQQVLLAWLFLYQKRFTWEISQRGNYLSPGLFTLKLVRLKTPTCS